MKQETNIAWMKTYNSFNISGLSLNKPGILNPEYQVVYSQYIYVDYVWQILLSKLEKVKLLHLSPMCGLRYF